MRLIISLNIRQRKPVFYYYFNKKGFNIGKTTLSDSLVFLLTL